MKGLFVSLSLVVVVGVLNALEADAQRSPVGGNWLELDGIDDYVRALDSDLNNPRFTFYAIPLRFTHHTLKWRYPNGNKRRLH